MIIGNAVLYKYVNYTMKISEDKYAEHAMKFISIYTVVPANYGDTFYMPKTYVVGGFTLFAGV